MQLDSTRIAIRERNLVDILDLSLHVTRAFLKPLLLTSCFCIVPLMLLNHSLLGWLLNDVTYRGGQSVDANHIVRYLWNMTLLVFIQAPLVSLFATVFLGRAVFEDRPPLKRIVKEVLQLVPALLWTYGVVRGVGIAVLLMLAVPARGAYSGFEALLIVVAVGVFIIRAMRPFINEIILLERAPLSSRRGGTSMGKRSSMLHGPSGADIFVRWLGSAFYAILLYFGFFGTFIFASGVLLNDWKLGPIMIKLGAPLAMWLVAVYFTVVRYLCYLDLRIRHEGWEVELRLRAEAVRLASRLT